MNEDIFQPRSIALKLINNRLEARNGRGRQNSSIVSPEGISNFQGF